MSSSFDDLESTVSDLSDSFDDFSDSFDDYTSDNDDNIGDIQDTLSANADSISALNDTAGQLVFPLTQDTIDLIKSVFITGRVTLGSGSTVIDPRIGTSSIILFSNVGASGTLGTLSAVVSNGQVVFGSSSGTDHSTINYLILP